jgi:uncharacterized protein YdeI (YjbR/CyaY-like superfamily)
MQQLSILEFGSSGEWEKWLEKNHSQPDGVWLKFAKKDSGKVTIQHKEALLSALCYGWIDAQSNKFDDKYYLIKFCPRRPRSVWSQHNRDYIEKLTAEGRMKPAGLAEVEAAKADGRWDKAYLPQSIAEMPEDFMKALAANQAAAEFFETLNRANRYAIIWRLHQAKRAETRAKNIEKFVTMLANHQTFH